MVYGDVVSLIKSCSGPIDLIVASGRRMRRSKPHKLMGELEKPGEEGIRMDPRIDLGSSSVVATAGNAEDGNNSGMGVPAGTSDLRENGLGPLGKTQSRSPSRPLINGTPLVALPSDSMPASLSASDGLFTGDESVSPAKRRDLAGDDANQSSVLDMTIRKSSKLGIGFTVSSNELQEIVVKQVFVGSSAHEQGLSVGDRLVQVNGVAVAGMRHKDALHLLTSTHSVVRLSVEMRHRDNLLSSDPARANSRGAVVIDGAGKVSSGSVLTTPLTTASTSIPASIAMVTRSAVSDTGEATGQSKRIPLNPGSAMCSEGPIETVSIVKGPRGLGIILVGGLGTSLGGCFISRIQPGSPAESDGRIRAGYRLIEVNGESLQHATHDDAIHAVRMATATVRLVVQVISEAQWQQLQIHSRQEEETTTPEPDVEPGEPGERMQWDPMRSGSVDRQQMESISPDGDRTPTNIDPSRDSDAPTPVPSDSPLLARSNTLLVDTGVALRQEHVEGEAQQPFTPSAMMMMPASSSGFESLHVDSAVAQVKTDPDVALVGAINASELPSFSHPPISEQQQIPLRSNESERVNGGTQLKDALDNSDEDDDQGPLPPPPPPPSSAPPLDIPRSSSFTGSYTPSSILPSIGRSSPLRVKENPNSSTTITALSKPTSGATIHMEEESTTSYSPSSSSVLKEGFSPTPSAPMASVVTMIPKHDASRSIILTESPISTPVAQSSASDILAPSSPNVAVSSNFDENISSHTYMSPSQSIGALSIDASLEPTVYASARASPKENNDHFMSLPTVSTSSSSHDQNKNLSGVASNISNGIVGDTPSSMPQAPTVTVVLTRMGGSFGFTVGTAVDAPGPHVVFIDPKGPAKANGRLSVGDHIIRVNNSDVGNLSPKEVEAMIEACPRAAGTLLRMQVRHENRQIDRQEPLAHLDDSPSSSMPSRPSVEGFLASSSQTTHSTPSESSHTVASLVNPTPSYSVSSSTNTDVNGTKESSTGSHPILLKEGSKSAIAKPSAGHGMGADDRPWDAQRAQARLDAGVDPTLVGQYITISIPRSTSGFGFSLTLSPKPVCFFARSVHPGGEAERAGLHPNDIILTVNNRPVRGETHAEVLERVRASASVLQLDLFRPYTGANVGEGACASEDSQIVSEINKKGDVSSSSSEIARASLGVHSNKDSMPLIHPTPAVLSHPSNVSVPTPHTASTPPSPLAAGPSSPSPKAPPSQPTTTEPSSASPSSSPPPPPPPALGPPSPSLPMTRSSPSPLSAVSPELGGSIHQPTSSFANPPRSLSPLSPSSSSPPPVPNSAPPGATPPSRSSSLKPHPLSIVNSSPVMAQYPSQSLGVSVSSTHQPSSSPPPPPLPEFFCSPPLYIVLH